MEREPRPSESPLQLTHDYRYPYRGYHTDGGVCRVRIFVGEGKEAGQVPVVIVSELPENTNTSVTNMAE